MYDDPKVTRTHRAQGFIDSKGNITAKGEEEAERRHFGDPDPPTIDDQYPSPGGYGWAPDPFPGGGLV
jgi:hypothetical protein